VKPIERVLGQLDKVRRVSDGWTAQCPAHHDRSPSLHVSEGDDGRVLLNCFATCTFDDVIGALGLDVADLFDDDRKRRMNILAEYDYVDENGELLYQAVRLSPKDFRQRRPDGNGGWSWKLDGVRRVLYRLPDVLEGAKAGRWIFVVEGEKDADRLRELGFVATCNPGGAGKWRQEFADALEGAKVAVLPDADTPGLDHAEAIAKSLKGAQTIKWVDLMEDVPEKGDVSDWLDAGHDPAELRELIEQAPEWHPPAEPTVDVGRVDLARIVRGEEPPTRPGLIYRDDGTGLVYPGAVHDLHGEPGHGKTWLVCYVIAEALRTGAGVLALDYEGAPHTFVERLRALGVADETIADADRVAYHNIPGVTHGDHVQVLASEVVELGAAFVSFDAMLPALARNGLDDNSNSDVASFYESTVRPLTRAGASVITLDHLTKDTTGRVRGARGAGAKLQLVDVSYAIKLVEPFSRHQEGAFKLVCAKDRFGTFGINENVALVRVIPSDGGAAVEIRIEPPSQSDAVAWNGPTHLMEEVSRYLEGEHLRSIDPPTQTEILDQVKGRRQWLLEALNELTNGRWTSKERDGRFIRYRLREPYREGDEPPQDMSE
jgi:5S rRNA maturation endonuclease (ribonuclease M5)